MYIVFDIGGSNTRIASSPDKQSIQNPKIFETSKVFESGFNNLISEIESIAAGEKIDGIAGGIAGLIEDNELIGSANLSDWVGKNFTSKLGEHFACAVSLENDAALGALGESVYGAGKEYASITYLALGTGIGGAWVTNKEIVGKHFEPGHQYIDYNSGNDLEQLINSAGTQEEKEKYLAVGIHNTLMLWPSNAVVLGGGKIINNDWSLENIKQEIQNLNSVYKYEPLLLLSQLKDESGLYGALKLL